MQDYFCITIPMLLEQLEAANPQAPSSPHSEELRASLFLTLLHSQISLLSPISSRFHLQGQRTVGLSCLPQRSWVGYY